MARTAKWVAFDDSKSMRSEASVLAFNTLLSKCRPNLVAGRTQPVDAQCQWGRLAVELDPLLRGGEPDAIEPARDKPLGMRPGDSQVEQSGLTVGWVVWPRW